MGGPHLSRNGAPQDGLCRVLHLTGELRARRTVHVSEAAVRAASAERIRVCVSVHHDHFNDECAVPPSRTILRT